MTEDGAIGNIALTPEEISRLTNLPLRDWFAGMAMLGMLANQNRVLHMRILATDAFDMADNMLDARKDPQ